MILKSFYAFLEFTLLGQQTDNSLQEQRAFTVRYELLFVGLGDSLIVKVLALQNEDLSSIPRT